MTEHWNMSGDAWSQLVSALDALAQGRGAVLLVQGEAGIGRTHLLAAAAKAAAQLGIPVCVGRADELTRWTPMAPLAAAVGETVWTGAGDAMRLATRLLDAISAQAAAGPLLIVLDDLQWADRMTLAALQSFVASLRALPVTWLLSCRDGMGDAIAVGRLFDRLAMEGAERTRVAPLPIAVVAQVLADTFGAPGDEALVALASGANGNPALVKVLVEGLTEERAVEVRDDRAVLVSSRLPGRVISLVRHRLDGFGTDTIELLEVAAILGRSFRVTDVAEVLGRNPADVLRAAREALRTGVLDSGEYGDELAFRHGLVWRGVSELVSPSVAAPLHWRIGLMLLRRKGATATATYHLLRGASPGDPSSVRALADAAAQVLDISPQAAADITAKALSFAPTDSDEYHDIAALRVIALQRLGRFAAAEELAHATLAGRIPASVEARVRAALAAAGVLAGHYVVAVTEAEFALAADEDGPAGRLARAAMLLAVSGLGERHRARRLAEEAVREQDADAIERDDVLHGSGLIVLAREQWADGELAEAVRSVRLATRCPARSWWDVPTPAPRLMIATLLTDIGDLSSAEVELAGAEVEIERADNLAHVLSLHIVKAWFHTRAGELAEAETEVAVGTKLSAELGATWFLPLATAVLATLAVRRGDLTEARSRLDQAAGEGPAHSRGRHCWIDLQLTHVQHGPEHVVSMMAGLYAHLLERPGPLLLEPAASAWLVRVALEVDDDGLAARVIEAAEELAAGNPAFPTAAAAAAHARGVLDRDLEPLKQAAGGYRDPWSRGSAVEDVAVVLADGRTRKETVASGVVTALETAMAHYEAAGSVRDVARIRRKLRDAGVRKRHWTHADRPATGWDSLTATERQVVELVAEGLTNRQVAARMFVSPHTVHAHLGRVFRKLGVNSRVELTSLRHRIG